MTTGKTIALTIPTFVGKVISQLFNTLSRFVIAILPRSKLLLILWLQSPSTLISEPKKMKSDTVSTFSSSICYEVIGPDGLIFIFWMLSFKPTFLLSIGIFHRKGWKIKSRQSPYRKTENMYRNRGGNSGNSVRLYFWGLQNHGRWWMQPWN